VEPKSQFTVSVRHSSSHGGLAPGTDGSAWRNSTTFCSFH
jgi:hypothetical protein